jgi:AcrR family transcriptional regulator
MKASTRKRAVYQPKDRHNRQDELVQVALEIFAEKGYAATGIQEVADAVGVLKGSLYHYIDSKEDLLFQIFDDAHVEAEQLMAEVDALNIDPIERLRFYLETSVRRSLQNLPLQTLYFRDWRYLTGERRDKLAARRRQYDHYLRGLIAKAYEHAGLKTGINLRYVSSFVIGGTNWVADWYRSDGPDSAEEVARSYADLAMAAVLGVAGPGGSQTKPGITGPRS